MGGSYVFEFSIDKPAGERTANFGGRVYANDKRAVNAALRMFRSRTSDANDEMAIYEGRVNGWGCVEGRLVGRVAYDPLGHGYRFLAADKKEVGGE